LVRIYFDRDKGVLGVAGSSGTNLKIIFTVAGDIRSDIDFYSWDW